MVKVKRGSKNVARRIRSYSYVKKNGTRVNVTSHDRNIRKNVYGDVMRRTERIIPVQPLSAEDLVRRIRANSSVIASRLAEVIEYSRILASGDFVSLLKKGIPFVVGKIHDEIESSDFYDNLQRDYSLSIEEILSLKEIIKQILEKAINFVADQILKNIQTKKVVQWAKEYIVQSVQNNVSKYLSEASVTYKEIGFPSYFYPRIERVIPYEIRSEIRQAQTKTFNPSSQGLRSTQRTQKVTVFIIHGAYGNPSENWFPWLKTELEIRGFRVFIPKFPTPNGQNFKSWLEVFRPYAQYLDENSILIGHSLGVPFILRLLERFKSPIKQCFLVSGFTGLLGNQQFDSINKTFVEDDFNWEKIKSNCDKFTLYHSRSDPYVPYEETLELRNRLSPEPRLIKDAGHFNKDAGYTKFKRLLIDVLSEFEGKN